MIEQLKLKAKEIIRMCNNIIALNNSPNEFVVNIIKREFVLILDSLEKEGRVIVLTKKKDLLASRAIYDSALDLKSDSDLFNEVFEFEKECKKLSLKQIKIQYRVGYN